LPTWDFDVDISPMFQTPEEAAKMAVENDVHIVGVSSLAAGHKTLVPQLIENLKKEGGEDIMVVVGGVIPPGITSFCLTAGAVGCFGPGTVVTDSANQVLNALENNGMNAEGMIEQYYVRVCWPATADLAKTITLIESIPRGTPGDGAQVIIDGPPAHTGKAVRLGITGVPGVGKSTFIESFGMMLVRKGASRGGTGRGPQQHPQRRQHHGGQDPHGALSVAPNAFIRPSPSGGHSAAWPARPGRPCWCARRPALT
jgi:methylmalonyl-CoA mutase cobalamin-binding domain/chain